MKKQILHFVIFGFFILVGTRCAKSGGSAPSMASDGPFLSCLEARQGGNLNSGSYTIYPAGLSAAGISVYCDMTTNGGGWTLVMKQKAGDGMTLQGDSTYWTNAALPGLNDTLANQNLSDENLISAAFKSLPITQLMLSAANESTVKTHNVVATNTFLAFNTPTIYSDDCNSSRPDWFIRTMNYPNGNPITTARFDFNFTQMSVASPGSNFCSARWGWTANQDTCTGGIGTADACGGLGAYGVQYGNTFMSNSKMIWQPATLYLWAR